MHANNTANIIDEIRSLPERYLNFTPQQVTCIYLDTEDDRFIMVQGERFQVHKLSVLQGVIASNILVDVTANLGKRSVAHYCGVSTYSGISVSIYIISISFPNYMLHNTNV